VLVLLLLLLLLLLTMLVFVEVLTDWTLRLVMVILLGFAR